MSSLSGLGNRLFGPVSSQWCLYFYYVSIFSFVLFLFSVGSLFVVLFKKNVSPILVGQNLYVVLSSFLMYFTNRLLHSMCASSVH